MPFAAAVSRHPVASHATGEVLGAVLEELAVPPEVAVLTATGAFAGALDDIAAAVAEVLRPGVLVGSTAAAVLAGDREVQDHDALVLFAGRAAGAGPGLAPRPVRIEADGRPGAGTAALRDEAGTLLLLVAASCGSVEDLLGDLAARNPALTVVGARASTAVGPALERLVLDGRTVTGGAVGVLFPAGAPVRAVLSQGARPVGEPLVVTAARPGLIEELAGRPALDRVLEIAEAASPEDRSALSRALHVGFVLDERAEHPAGADVLVRAVHGADRTTGAVAVDGDVAVGTVVRLQVRDARAATLDLHEQLAAATAGGALVFPDLARGRELFGAPHHDAAAVVDHVAGRAIAGLFGAGVIGPVHGRTLLHRGSLAALLFDHA